MIIDFEKLPEIEVKNHFGGEGSLFNKTYMDEANAIVRGVIPPGATSGYHIHQKGCEIMYILKGSLLFKYDDGEERVSEGQVHYCPAGHYHQMINDTDKNCEFFSVVVK